MSTPNKIINFFVDTIKHSPHNKRMDKEQTLIQRIKEGLFSLDNLSKPKLLSMYREANSQELKDMLGCAYMYYKEDK